MVEESRDGKRLAGLFVGVFSTKMQKGDASSPSTARRPEAAAAVIAGSACDRRGN